jgi:hypothetical protein
MSNVTINKKLKIEVRLDNTIKDPDNDPAIQQKAKKAVSFLRKHGVPKSMSKKNK